MEVEIWKAVVGYEGLYEVSNLGRIKSLPSRVYNGNGYFITKNLILKTAQYGCRYPDVGLRKDGKTKTERVHILVACAFLNHIPGGNKMVVDHINGQITDNRVENLRIVTNRFNCSLGARINRDRLSSQYVGVFLDKAESKWRSAIFINGKQKFSGYFKNEIDASNWYQDELAIYISLNK